MRCFEVAERVLKYSGEPKSRRCEVSKLRTGLSIILESRSHEDAKFRSCGVVINIFWGAEVTKMRCFDVADRVVNNFGEPKSRRCEVSKLRRGY